MQYILEVENIPKKIEVLKEEILRKRLRYNISGVKGEYYFFGLGNCQNKKYYLFDVPDDIENISEYFQNNIDLIDIRPTFIEKSIFDLKSKFHLFSDVYKTEDFTLSSSEDETVFYLRNNNGKRLTNVDYRTVINILRDYYADLWGLDLEVGDYSIIYLYTTDHKFCKILVEPNMHLNYDNKPVSTNNKRILKRVNSSEN